MDTVLPYDHYPANVMYKARFQASTID